MQRHSRGSRNRRSVLADEAERQGLNTTYTTATSVQQLQNTGRRMPHPIPEHAVTQAPGIFMTPATARTGIPIRRHLEMSAVNVRSSMSDLRTLQQLPPQSARSAAQRGSQMQRTLSLLDLQQSQSQLSQRSPGASLYSTSRTGAIEGASGSALITGNLYIPEVSDKETLSNMAKKIVEVLGNYGFQTRSGGTFTREDIKRINSKEFNTICLGLLGRLCYPFPNREKGKDKAPVNESQTMEELRFIKESLHKIGFPLTFNVTHFVYIKPNSPMVLTILSFLCCVYEELMEVETDRSELSFLQQAEWLLVRSITQLFGSCHQGSDMTTSLPQQLEFFKMQIGNLAQATDVLEGKTLEQVKEQIAEKKKELVQLLAVPDPGQDLRQKIVAQKEQIDVLKQRLGEIKRTRGNYQDLRSLEYERKTLEIELQAAERHLADVLRELARQNITPEDLQNMKEKFAATEHQIETLKNLVDESAIERKKKEEFVKNDQQRCYEEISSLKIVDRYNREASKLSKYSIPKLDANPVDLDELEPWLKQMTAKGRFVEEQVERSCADVKTAIQSKTLRRAAAEIEVKRLKDLLEHERASRETDCVIVDDITQKKKQIEEKKIIAQETLEMLMNQKSSLDERQEEVAGKLAESKTNLEKVKKLADQTTDDVEFNQSLMHSTAVQRTGELMAAIKEDLEKWENPFDYDKMVAEVQAEVAEILKPKKVKTRTESSENAINGDAPASASTSSQSQE